MVWLRFGKALVLTSLKFLVSITLDIKCIFSALTPGLTSVKTESLRKRISFSQLSEYEKGRIIGLRQAGFSFREIADRVNLSPATVRRCCTN